MKVSAASSLAITCLIARSTSANVLVIRVTVVCAHENLNDGGIAVPVKRQITAAAKPVESRFFDGLARGQGVVTRYLYVQNHVAE